MLKPIFYWKYSSPTFLGSFFAIFCDFRRVNVKISVFDPQKALPCPKRRLPVYFMKLSDKRCGLHPGSRTQKKKKMPSRMYMLGVCRKVTPYANVMKLGTVGLIGYCNLALTDCWVSTPELVNRCGPTAVRAITYPMRPTVPSFITFA